MGMSSPAVAKENGKSERSHAGPSHPGRIATHVGTLDELVGAHPDALRKIYRGGLPADPADLGESPRGRVLSLELGADLFLLLRPVVRAFASGAFPWKGKVFDHGGNAGQNVVFGKTMVRFRTELGASDVDGKPTLALLYDSPAFANPWPIRAIRDELRSIGPGLAIGPAFMEIGGARRPLLWFGLEAT
jgi:hypothetical protein